MNNAAPVASAPRATFPWLTILVVLAAAGAHFWPHAERSLALIRERVLAGEVWRVWTGHVVHFGGSHLLLNLIVLAPAGVWIERLAPRAARIFYLCAPAVIAAALLLLDSRLETYAGLSGLAAGLLALLALTQLRRPARRDRWFWWCVLALLAGKVAFEIMIQRPAFARLDEAGGQSVPLAHVIGIAFAVALHFAPGPMRRRRE